MISYAQIALALLQFVNWLLKLKNDRQQFNAGEDHQIAEQAKAVLGMTEEGKRILEKINAMPDGELDDLDDAIGRAG